MKTCLPELKTSSTAQPHNINTNLPRDFILSKQNINRVRKIKESSSSITQGNLKLVINLKFSHNIKKENNSIFKEFQPNRNEIIMLKKFG